MIDINKLFTEDRAVSPVVGVALLIAIAVILAAVIGAVVLGLGSGGVETPQAQLQGDYLGAYDIDEDGTDETNVFEIEHRGGEPIPGDEVSFDDGTAYWSDGTEFSDGEEFTTGDTIYVEASSTELTMLWEDPNSDSETILEEFEE